MITQQLHGQPTGGNAATQLARRARQRRIELGLTRAEVAARARLDPAVVEHVEGQPVALTAGMLVRLAEALETSVTDLVGPLPDRAPGRGHAAPRPVLTTLTDAECRQLLDRGGIGRIGCLDGDQPVVLPVNYAVHHGRLIFRVAPGSDLAQHAHGKVAFEVDRIDEGMREGWSVLVLGRARMLTEAEVRTVAADVWLEPWAGGDRDVFIRIDPHHTSGRRIRAW
jgi:nitroimidazol reductase NimA-like FMN-containing flavoprotein (pyridoxamine 5'-phosphate oxidase superfamily)